MARTGTLILTHLVMGGSNLEQLLCLSTVTSQIIQLYEKIKTTVVLRGIHENKFYFSYRHTRKKVYAN